MKEDVLKFRKLCDILVKEYNMSVNQISIDSGITWPTMKKLREEDINTIGIKASILGQIQNYLHKKSDIVNLGDMKFSKSEIAGIEVHEKLEKEITEKQKFHEAISDPGNEILDNLTKGDNPITIKETIKYIKPEKDNAKPIVDIIKQKTRGLALDNPKRINKDDSKNTSMEQIPTRSLVEIIVFLRMEATRYRSLAHDFEVAAEILVKDR